MFHGILGAVVTAGLFLLINYAQEKELHLTLWKWLLTVLGLLYGTFVIEVIYGFLAEGAPKAALVMGLATGVVAAIWGVLLGRYVFKPAK